MTTPSVPSSRTVGRVVPGTPDALVPAALVPGAGTTTEGPTPEPVTTGSSGTFAARAYSEVEICNLALSVIGAGTIRSLGDGTRAARTCKLFWPTIRQAVFEAVPWHCISKRATLTEEGDAPAWGYRISYRLPADFVRMIAMDKGYAAYQIVGPYLQTDRNPAQIEYVYMCVDGTRYSAQLVRCLYLSLAYELAFSLTGDASLADPIKKDLEQFMLPLARFTNSIAIGARELEGSPLLDMFA